MKYNWLRFLFSDHMITRSTPQHALDLVKKIENELRTKPGSRPAEHKKKVLGWPFLTE